MTTETTVSFFPMMPRFHRAFHPAVPVTPAGSPNTPQVIPSSFCAAMISAIGDIYHKAVGTPGWPSAPCPHSRGTPTAMESASVFSSIGCHGRFAAIARLIGWHLRLSGDQPGQAVDEPHGIQDP